MAEPRKYTRYDTQGSAILKSLDGTQGGINVDLINLSFLGIGVCAQEKIGEGVDVNFELTFSLWNEPVTGKGRIKYVREVKKDDARFFVMGICFIEVNQRTIEYIINRIRTGIQAKTRKKSQKQTCSDLDGF